MTATERDAVAPASLRFTVAGADCPSCAATIERAVAGVHGVRAARVDYVAGTLTVETAGAVDPAAIGAASAAAGYPASPAPAGRREWVVEGLGCAECVRTVTAAVGRLPGVGDVALTLGTGRLCLTLDEGQTPPARVVQTIRALGYTARPPARALAPPPAWYRTPKGRLVLGSGALLALAAAFSRVEPRLAFWGYVVATLLAAAPVVRKAVAAARAGRPADINALVAVAALGALAIGAAAEGAVVVFLFAIGELLEGLAAGRARHAIEALAAVVPRTALLLTADGAREVAADSLAPGDRVRVPPGARVPADGVVLAGESGVDEAPITGESAPVAKEAGAGVYAGSINGDGALTVEVRAEAADTTLARIVRLVMEAEAGKAPTARFIDRFARYYTPLVLLAAALTAVVPPLAFGGAWHAWIYKALALLLIGCPCALVLSTPAAITSALAAGARQGLLVKGGAALEALGKVRAVAFDKTGTLTAGEPRVTDVVPLDGATEREVLALAAAVEATATHPLARAVVAAAEARGVAYDVATDARARPGRAVTATVAGRALAVGSPRHAAEAGAASPALDAAVARLEGAGKTAIVLLDDGRARGVLGLRDEPRPDAGAGLAALHQLGVASLMLTGDNRRTGAAIGAALGVAVEAELLPEDKVAAVRRLRARGPVAMVGDGINDAPALATADVGIAMGGGADVALETADAALLRGAVTGVADLVRLSRAAMGNIQQNVAFALGLKALFLVTTLLGVTNLWLAVLSDTGATALVTLNALRLLRFRARR
ncbi:MAG TPA: heavy metal translocating P-type ATPase [Thermomicrobiales bacterium]|nr:heavy metal translocating P-type ATPase [Thermomicrobiales bacterium]